MSNRNETFGRLLKGAINSIAAYEGKTAPAVEDDLGQQIGLAGSALQRYKAGNLPPEPRTVEIIANAALRRAYLSRPWLEVFLQAARYPQPDALLARLLGENTLPVPAPTSMPGGTVTFLFTDIVGSTQLWEAHAPAMQRALARHDSILRQAITDQGGYVFKTVGDAFCAAFATAPAALQAALNLQRHIMAEPWSASGLPEPLLVRAVLHTGAAEQRDGDYFGPPLNRVARLCGVGHGGQILLSLAAQELARDQLPAGTSLRDLGEQRMKDLARPERIFQLLAPDLPAAFPPLKTLDTARHNLPAQPTALIGREAEVEAVCDLVREPATRLLTLTGPGGTGKTRLALQVAGELVEEFADGAWFVALAPISDANLVASAIGTALGLREQGSRPMHELLHDYLREKALLLVLDNFEQVSDAAPLVGGLLATAAHIKIVVTSRVVLHLYGEREYAVPPLSLPQRIPPPTFARLTQYEAVRLFIERARAVRADFAITVENAPLIAEICHRLDGLPLAIELAAARSKLFAPQAILNRLDRRLATLTGGARDLPARQQTLRGAIEWSYNLLDAGEQEAFARLGVFVGGCTIEAAEAVLLAGGELLIEPLDVLSSLVDKSLLKQIEGANGEPRFTMLETIREYALERLAAGGVEEQLCRQHATYFLAYGEQGYALEGTISDTEHNAWVGSYRHEYDNIRAALDWSHTTGDADMALRLVNAISPIWWDYGVRSEAIIWFERILHSSSKLTGSGVHLRARWELGLFYAMTGQYKEAQHQYELALDMARVLKVHQAELLERLGWLAREQGHSSTAWPYLIESLALFRAQNDAAGVAYTLNTMAGVAIIEEDPDRAEALLLESREVAQGNTGTTVGWMLNHLGHCAQLRGHYEQALSLHQDSLSYFSERYHAAQVEVYHCLGECALGLGRIDEAKGYLVQALTVAKEGSYQAGIAWCLASLGSAAALTGQPERAARLGGAAEKLRALINCRIAPATRATYERAQALARAALSDKAYAAAWAAGRALSGEEAIAEALGWAGTQNHESAKVSESHGNGSTEAAKTTM
jgi:predicted ATPase/class 3 adenylate cyclase